MSTTPELRVQYEVEQFLYRVASLCDDQRWEEYLDCFSEDAAFHVPQWDGEHRYTTDPRREMSLIYYPDRSGLEDRVFRLRTGRSAASNPMPRTLHQIANVQCRAGEGGWLEVSAKWVTDYYRFDEAHRLFGSVNYRLREAGRGLQICYKQAIVLNDKIDSVLDFYHV